MITKELLFELPEALSEPKVVNKFFTDEMFARVKETINKTGLGTDELFFHTMYARWEASQIKFDDDIEEYCLQKTKEIFNDNTLKKAYFFATRYQYKNGCIPHLWEHVDQNGTQTTIDITIENTADWGIIVEGQHFQQTENDAIVFCGQQHTHSRPPYPTRDPNKYTTVLFLHFTQPDHWIQEGQKNIQKYGVDGNVRFFNRNRFMPLPDPPVNQVTCQCHDYSQMLKLYDDIAGHAVTEEPELAEMPILSKEELAPGIIRYKTPKESSRIIKGLIQNAMFKQWQPAEVLNKGKGPGIDYDTRNCFNYFLTDTQSFCHPQDPIRRAKESLTKGINAIVEDYRNRYEIVELISNATVLLRYEDNNKFNNHIDDHPRYPRVVSVSMFLNDDFEGGELEFKEFNLKIKPEAGDVIVFCSAFPYSHQVNPVRIGTRYSVVKWYEFKR